MLLIRPLIQHIYICVLCSSANIIRQKLCTSVISSFLIKFSSLKKIKQTATKTDGTDFIQVNANDKSAKKQQKKLQKCFFYKTKMEKIHMERDYFFKNKLSLDQSCSWHLKWSSVRTRWTVFVLLFWQQCSYFSICSPACVLALCVFLT